MGPVYMQVHMQEHFLFTVSPHPWLLSEEEEGGGGGRKRMTIKAADSCMG